MQPAAQQEQPTIFVGELPKDMTEQVLNEIVKQYQPTRITIPRNPVTRETKGYAFITFPTQERAAEARSKLNGYKIGPIRLRFSAYAKNVEKEANVFVKSIHPDVDVRELEASFERYGKILSSKISYDGEGVSRGYGFVQFESRTEAERAIAEGRNIDLHGTIISVDRFVPIQQRVDQFDKKNLHIRGFGADMTSERLTEIFGEFGPVTSHAIMNTANKKTGDMLYFGFVSYGEIEHAQGAIDALHAKEIDGVPWYVVHNEKKYLRIARLREEFKQKQEDYKQRNLYVSKLPKELTEGQFAEICQQFGAIDSVKLLVIENVAYNEEGKMQLSQIGKGSGFVCYRTSAEALEALTKLRQTNIQGVNPYVAKWLPREELSRKLKKNQDMRMKGPAMYMHGQMAAPWIPRGMFRGRGGMMMPPMPGHRGGGMMPHMGMMGFSMPQQMGEGRRPMGRAQPQHPAMQPPIAPPMARAQPTQAPPPPQPRPQPSMAQSNDIPGVDMSTFGAADDQKKKHMLGTRIYQMLMDQYPEKLTSKLTGMIIEMPVPQLIELVKDPSKLASCVTAAKDVLKKHLMNQPGNEELIKALG